MAGIFGTDAFFQTDVNLIIQVVMFLIIVIGLVYKNKRKFKIHGTLMGIALILHVLSFLLVMGPSFSQAYEYFTTATSNAGVQSILIHVVPGAVAMIMGIILVGLWALRPSNLAACARRKRLMDITVLLWLISLVFGVAAYIFFYV